jgi:carbon monoxide dehydrogenase subunit G
MAMMYLSIGRSSYNGSRKGTQSMELRGTHTFASASPQQVWNALHDSNMLKACLPGVDNVEWQGDNAIAFAGGIGPFKLAGWAQVSEQTPPSHMKITANRASGSAAVTVDLAPSGAGTLLSYAGTAEGSGAVGAGLAMARPLIEGQLNSFFSKLEGQIA